MALGNLDERRLFRLFFFFLQRAVFQAVSVASEMASSPLQLASSPPELASSPSEMSEVIRLSKKGVPGYFATKNAA